MSLLRTHPCRLPIRTLSTATTRAASSSASSLQLERNSPDAVADTVPPYPHGPARWYKQSNKGLYGGQRIQFGNNVSGDFNTKTRRTFDVNVLSKRLWSHALHRFVQVRVSARTLRTIDRVGGLDEYLLGDKAGRIKQLGVSGWWLRWAIMQQPSVRKRFEEEKRILGLGSSQEYERQLKALEKSTVGVNLDEAYAALPEESEVEAAALEYEPLEAKERDEAHAVLPEEDEVEAAVLAEETAISEADGLEESSSITITNPPDLPPLTFRTDHDTHIVLTPHGWRRFSPDRTETTKQYIADRKFPGYVDKQMELFQVELEELKSSQLGVLSLEEEKAVLRDARGRFTRQLAEKVEERVGAGSRWAEARREARRKQREARDGEKARRREDREEVRYARRTRKAERELMSEVKE